MRIGIDMLGVQSDDHRGRGIGRYCSELCRTLFREARSHRFILYRHEGLPWGEQFQGPNTSIRTLPRDPSGRISSDALARKVADNPDGLDVLLLPSPFERCIDFRTPERPVHGLPLVAVVYDLIQLRFSERYLPDERSRRQFHAALATLRRYDALLTISESTRLDCVQLLGLPPQQVVTIGTASNRDFFTPETTRPMPAADREALFLLGVRPPFVLTVGGEDDRKNIQGLIDGFAGLPACLREPHELVVVCQYSPGYAARVREYAERRGVGGSLVLLGGTSDEALRRLYRHCAVFVFPSFYEGFGLPILEAMHCGAPVIAGRNSSQVEVVGEAGLTFDVHDSSELTERLAAVLDGPALSERLRQASLVQACRFQWEQTAAQAMAALERVCGWSGDLARPNAPRRQLRPRIALMSPLPPLRSGISDYTARLIEHLAEHYAIDVYHDTGYVPYLQLQDNDFGCFEHRLFERFALARNYRAVLYQMGNSSFHKYIYDRLDRWPGVVILHDFSLVGFQYWYGLQPGAEPHHFRRAFEDFVRLLPDDSRPLWDEVAADPRGPLESCIDRMLFLNQKIFDASSAVIVHSRWCQEHAHRLYPERAGAVYRASYGAQPEVYSPERKAAVRQRFDIPPEALVLTSLGLVANTKLAAESIMAFAKLAQRRADALLLFVGAEVDGGESRRTVERLDLTRQVRFLGHFPADRLSDFGAISDVGICLRRPPTNGETSAALLDLLRLGVPTIVSDVGTFSEYPDTVVRKVPWAGTDLEPLCKAMVELAENPEMRNALGRSALQYVVDVHGWSQLASRYAEIIEETHARMRRQREGCKDSHARLPRAALALGRPELHRIRTSGGTTPIFGEGRGMSASR
jgi:glycosyltransferase involved in cell wall biosynthesis